MVASISASNRVQNILTCPLETMGATMATYCSQNYGANRIDRVRQASGRQPSSPPFTA